MENRIETAIYKMFQAQSLRNQAEALDDDVNSLLFVSEVQNPASVKGINIQALKRHGIAIGNNEFGDRQASFGATIIPLSNDEYPQDAIFKAAVKAFGK